MEENSQVEIRIHLKQILMRLERVHILNKVAHKIPKLAKSLNFGICLPSSSSRHMTSPQASQKHYTSFTHVMYPSGNDVLSLTGYNSAYKR
jgi:hypothetical protein